MSPITPEQLEKIAKAAAANRAAQDAISEEQRKGEPSWN